MEAPPGYIRMVSAALEWETARPDFKGGDVKLVFFDDFKLGVLKGDSVVDVSGVAKEIPQTSPQDLVNHLIEGFSRYRGHLEEAVNRGAGVPVSQVRIRPPVPKPYNIVAMAANYMEDGTREKPADIDAFPKSPSTVIGNGDTIVLPDIPATIFEGEAELAIVIGKRASRLKAEEAYDYIFGYMNFIDGSARGFRPEGRNSFYWGKCWDTFAPMGPCLVTADEVHAPQNLQVKLWVNGTLKQDYNTSDMAYKIPRVVEWVSSVHPLEPGDVIATGTNHRGLSAIQDGDQIEVETEGLGRLWVRVRDDLKRTWGRETRLEMAEKGVGGTTPQLTGKYATGS